MPRHTSFLPVKKTPANSVDLFPNKVMPNLISCGPVIRRQQNSLFFFNNGGQLKELGRNFSAISIASFLDN